MTGILEFLKGLKELILQLDLVVRGMQALIGVLPSVFGTFTSLLSKKNLQEKELSAADVVNVEYLIDLFTQCFWAYIAAVMIALCFAVIWSSQIKVRGGYALPFIEESIQRRRYWMFNRFGIVIYLLAVAIFVMPNPHFAFRMLDVASEQAPFLSFSVVLIPLSFLIGFYCFSAILLPIQARPVLPGWWRIASAPARLS